MKAPTRDLFVFMGELGYRVRHLEPWIAPDGAISLSDSLRFADPPCEGVGGKCLAVFGIMSYICGMNTFDTSPAPTPPHDGTAAAAEAAAVARELAMLEELSGTGMEMVRELKYRGRRGEEADPVRAYERLNRAIRRTIALKMKLRETLKQGPARAYVPVPAPARAKKVLSAEAQAEKARLRALLADSIREQCDLADHERLLDDLETRLEASDLEDELGNRPIGQIFELICRDLGLGADLRPFSAAELGISAERAANLAEFEQLCREYMAEKDAAAAAAAAQAAGDAPALVAEKAVGPRHIPVRREELGPGPKWAFPEEDEGPLPEGALRKPWRPPKPGE